MAKRKTKRTNQSKNKEKKHITVITTVLVILALVSLSQSPLIENLKKDKDIVIYFPEITDFPNPEQGTVVFNFGFPDGSFKVGGKEADILMFLNSQTIPGLEVSYNTREKKVYAGLPQINSNEVAILDGKNHQLAYIFNRKEKKQLIVLDNKLIAESEFTGKEEKYVLTGYAIKDKKQWIASPIDIEFWIQ